MSGTDDRRGAVFISVAAAIITASFAAFGALMNPGMRLDELLARVAAAWGLILLWGGLMFTASVAWRSCRVLVMTPLTMWNNLVSTPGDRGYTGEVEIGLLLMAQLLVAFAALFAKLAVYGLRTKLAISPVVIAWAMLPLIAILVGLLCRAGELVARAVRRAYAQTEAEMYGRAADDGDERKGGLTEAGRE